jgi:hypothetical protein
MTRFAIIVYTMCILASFAPPPPIYCREPNPHQVEFDRLVTELQSQNTDLSEAAKTKLIGKGMLGLWELRNRNLQKLGSFEAIQSSILKEAKQKARVYAVGVHHAENDKKEVVVRISKIRHPFFLIVSAYHSVNWKIEIDDVSQTHLIQTLVGGYKTQKLLNQSLPAIHYCYDEGKRTEGGKIVYFFAYQHDEKQFPDMQVKLKQLIDKDRIVLQGRYEYIRQPFEITGD